MCVEPQVVIIMRRGGDMWDDELCPNCTNDLPNKVSMVGGAILTIAALIGKRK